MIVDFVLKEKRRAEQRDIANSTINTKKEKNTPKIEEKWFFFFYCIAVTFA